MPCNRPGEKKYDTDFRYGLRIPDTDCGLRIADCGLRSQRAGGRAGPFARGLALGNGAAARPGADLPVIKQKVLRPNGVLFWFYWGQALTW